MSDPAPILIGAIDDISGEGNDSYRRMVEVGMAEALERRRLARPIELRWRWAEGLPRGTTDAVLQAFQAHVDTGVLAVLGPTITDNCLALRDLVDAARVPALTWPGGDECRSDFMFQYQAGSLEDEPVLIAEFLARRGLTKVAVVHDRAATGLRLLEGFERTAPTHGLRIVAKHGMAALDSPVEPSFFGDLLGSGADAIAHFGMFGIRPLSQGLLERASTTPVVSNIIGCMGLNRPEWREALEGWVYVDMVSDDNARLAEMRPRLPADHPRGPRLVSGLDIGRLLVEGLANAPQLSPEGVRDGFERTKWLPACAGRAGTRMGFGHHDRGALKGEFLVLRQYVNGESVEVRGVKVLEGIRVIEVAQWGFVPSAAAILAEWGAEVIKIEDPEQGEPMRNLQVADIGPGTGGFDPMWEIVGRGKRCVGIDLRVEAGRELLLRLVDTADVFLTSFLPDARARLGIDVDDIRQRNPKIIYARGSGQGPRGEEAGKGGFDAISFWSRSGLAHASVPPGGEWPPKLPGPAFGDLISGANLAGGVAAALAHRERTGHASVVDVSLLNSGMWGIQANIVGALLNANPNIAWPSTRDAPSNVLAATYRTSDGRFVNLNVLQGDRYWPELCQALGRPDLLDHPHFVDAAARAAHSSECRAVLDEVFAGRTLAEWQERLAAQDGQWDVVRTPGEAGADPQAWSNEYLRAVDYGDGRCITLVAAPAQFDESGNPTTPAPGHGADTDDVLLELGLDMDQLIELKLGGAIL